MGRTVTTALGIGAFVSASRMRTETGGWIRLHPPEMEIKSAM
jgi:hypothetical protein